jgi:hypothetical protein
MVTDQTAKTTIYYTPYNGQSCPLYDGSNFAMADLGGELSQTTTDTTKSPAAVVAEACYDMFVWDDAGTKRCTRGPVWDAHATITVTIATPAVVSWTAHGLHEGSPVIFTTDGALPTGITAGTTYYVGRSPAADTFNISTSIANAAAGTFVATSGTQSGTHTGTNRDSVRGTAAALVLTKGIQLNNATITNGPAASRGTWVGTVRSNASSQMDWILGGTAAAGTAGFFGVWNAYNRVASSSLSIMSAANWAYTGTARGPNASTTMRATFVCGAVEDPVEGTYITAAVSSTDNFGASIGLDASNAVASKAAISAAGVTGGLTTLSPHFVGVPSAVGAHFLTALEIGAAGTTYFGSSTPGNINGFFFEFMM